MSASESGQKLFEAAEKIYEYGPDDEEITFIDAITDLYLHAKNKGYDIDHIRRCVTMHTEDEE